MKETRRERKIRLLLIVSACCVIIIGFVWPSSLQKSESNKEKVPMNQAQVLARANAEVNPIVAVSKIVDKQQLLILYEVEKNNDYFFNVQNSISLNDTIKKLFLDESRTKIWVQTVNDKWILFSNSLNVIQQTKEKPKELKSSSVEFKYESSSKLITVPSTENVHISLIKNKKPLNVHFISSSLWLIVFEDELQIAKGS